MTRLWRNLEKFLIRVRNEIASFVRQFQYSSLGNDMHHVSFGFYFGRLQA